MRAFPRKSQSQPIIRFFAVVAAIFFAASVSSAQVKSQKAPAEPQTQSPFADALNKNPELLKEFGNLIGQFQHNVQYPGPRSESRLLPRLPASATLFGAFPNYGQVSSQALKILRQELQNNAAFRDWWHQGDMATGGPKLEAALEQFAALNDYLGDEIVVSGAASVGKESSFVMVAEVRKPGLKKYLEQMFLNFPGNPKSKIRVFGPQELAAAVDGGAQQDGVILVRQDFVVAGKTLAAVRNFSSHLDQPGGDFTATPFGNKIAREYQHGVTVLAAADLQRSIIQASPAAKQTAAFRQSGFADAQYLLWESRRVEGKSVNQMELSFSGPRRGAAAWLAKSGPLNSLDFVSPDAILSATLLLSNPAQIFDDVKGLASLSNPNAFASLPMVEQALHLSVRDDLFGQLRGDITFELDSAAPPKPDWRVILGVQDSDRLHRALNSILAIANLVPRRDEIGGVSYFTLPIPTPKTATPLTYAFVDGHLIVGASQDAVAKSIQLNRSGNSLAKSRKLQALIPPGQSLNASGLFYEDPISIAAMQMRNTAPQMADSIAASLKDLTPTAAWFYGEDSAIREQSSRSTFDIGAFAIVAAIAIPNLMRSRSAANEAAAVATVRKVNSAQLIYKTNFPQRGYAATLPALGSEPNGTLAKSADHADLLSNSFTGEICNSDGWCLKDGFRFKLAAACTQRSCQDYVLLAAPISSSSGTRNLCSTSDGVIRAKPGAPWDAALTVSDCKVWQPIQ